MVAYLPELRSPSYAEEEAAAIATEGLRVNIGGRDVVWNLTVGFPQNKITAIIGPTGCGKTTVLRALNRLHDGAPNIQVSGKVLLNGVDVYRDVKNVREVRRRIGMLFQRPNPFPQSILENVEIGPRSHGLLAGRQLRAHAEQQLRDVGLWDAVKDRLGASPFNLSGGQQQLLCLARALAVDPDVLLLDEPTSSLDPNTTLRVEELFKSLSERMSLVIVTHNLQQARRLADNVLFLMGGHKIEFAPAQQFFEAPADPRTRAYIAEALG